VLGAPPAFVLSQDQTLRVIFKALRLSLPLWFVSASPAFLARGLPLASACPFSCHYPVFKVLFAAMFLIAAYID
jgi:hypothetical protein